MCRLAELGWTKEDDAYRQFFTTQFLPAGTRRQGVGQDHSQFPRFSMYWASSHAGMRSWEAGFGK